MNSVAKLEVEVTSLNPVSVQFYANGVNVNNVFGKYIMEIEVWNALPIRHKCAKRYFSPSLPHKHTQKKFNA